MDTPLIVIDPKAKKAFVRAVGTLEDCAANGNTWGADIDARILANTLLSGARLNRRDHRLIVDALYERIEDLSYRLRNYPQDYDDHRAVEKRIAAMERLLEKLLKEDDRA